MVAGLIFFVASVFTFKQHRDNPTQVPIGKPITQNVYFCGIDVLGNYSTFKTFAWIVMQTIIQKKF